MGNLLREITQPTLHRGLEGVVVAESALSVIDGDAGELLYRGYPIEDVARQASYEELLYLFWHGELPDADELAAFEETMAEERAVADAVLDTLRELAAADEKPMAALRTAASTLSATDPEPDAAADDLDATLRKGRRITAKLPTALAAFERFRRGESPVAPRADLGHAANFLYMLDGAEPEPVAAETFDQALVLHADHGLNASTFTAMTIASTYADIYNAVTGAVGALAGPWHGGANQEVVETLRSIREAGRDPVEWARETVEAGDRIPGFGHRVYNVTDPRAVILRERGAELAEETGERGLYGMTRDIETYLTEETDLPEKGIAPNVDFYSGTVYRQLGIPVDLYTPIFALSRVAGWVAHVLEYQEGNRLIRPRARYVGPERRSFVPVAER